MRGQLEGSMIPDRQDDTGAPLQGVTDNSKEEIDILQVSVGHFVM